MSRPRIVVVGGGFAGYHALRRLERTLPAEAAELVLVNPSDYLLYSPLLPDVSAGVVEPRHIAVSLRQQLRRTRVVLGSATDVDHQAKTVTVRTTDDGGATEEVVTLSYDRLVLVPGSITRQFDIPGVAERAHGVKTLVEAQFLRDHLLRQLDRADALPAGPEHDAERRARMTVVAVGAGYTGTEIVAQLQYWLGTIAARWSTVRPEDISWVLVDLAESVLPELGPELGERALGALRRRGIDVRLGVTVKEAREGETELTDGSTIPSRTLVWGAGVAASPLVETLDLPLQKGRLVVRPDLSVPGADGVFAGGDAAAVPDLTQEGAPLTPPTAQHAQRQGTALGRNVAASLGFGTAKEYRHHDLGLVADLGGRDAIAKPLGLKLHGPLAKLVARGYHLYALPSVANRVRVGTDWLLAALLPAQSVEVTRIRPDQALVSTAQQSAAHLRD
ncbi:NAD(P)/FAD-dependent oxidoreductase [Klenkia sp. LSe6-5]|uniref:NAD(P)/FAD-dependent oxidoreductase n=1 Tax=Klenkia sesuvii TaxID=3103137 RepID=A0ABU8DX62_9ACTN